MKKIGLIGMQLVSKQQEYLLVYDNNYKLYIVLPTQNSDYVDFTRYGVVNPIDKKATSTKVLENNTNLKNR